MYISYILYVYIVHKMLSTTLKGLRKNNKKEKKKLENIN